VGRRAHPDSTNSSRFDLHSNRSSSPAKKITTIKVVGGLMVATTPPTEATTAPVAPPTTRLRLARRPGPPSSTPGPAQSRCGWVQGGFRQQPQRPPQAMMAGFHPSSMYLAKLGLRRLLHWRRFLSTPASFSSNRAPCSPGRPHRPGIRGRGPGISSLLLIPSTP
jgi:hypothetical protein